jgi:alanyl-tRNA synthetase
MFNKCVYLALSFKDDGTTADLLLDKTKATLEELAEVKKDVQQLQQQFALLQLEDALEKPSLVNDIHVVTATIENVEVDVLRMLLIGLAKVPSKSVAVLGSESNGSPIIVASLTEDLVKQGYHAGDLAKAVAKPLGGSGGGRPTLAQAGGKDASKLKEAIHLTLEWVKAKQAG